MSMLRTLKHIEGNEFYIAFDELMMIEIEELFPKSVFYPWEKGFPQRLRDLEEATNTIIKGEPTFLVYLKELEDMIKFVNFVEKYNLVSENPFAFSNNSIILVSDKILIHTTYRKKIIHSAIVHI